MNYLLPILIQCIFFLILGWKTESTNVKSHHIIEKTHELKLTPVDFQNQKVNTLRDVIDKLRKNSQTDNRLDDSTNYEKLQQLTQAQIHVATLKLQINSLNQSISTIKATDPVIQQLKNG